MIETLGDSSQTHLQIYILLFLIPNMENKKSSKNHLFNFYVVFLYIKIRQINIQPTKLTSACPSRAGLPHLLPAEIKTVPEKHSAKLKHRLCALENTPRQRVRAHMKRTLTVQVDVHANRHEIQHVYIRLRGVLV